VSGFDVILMQNSGLWCPALGRLRCGQLPDFHHPPNVGRPAFIVANSIYVSDQVPPAVFNADKPPGGNSFGNSILVILDGRE